MAKMPSNPGVYGAEVRVTLVEFIMVILVTLVGSVTVTLDFVETALADTMNWPFICVGWTSHLKKYDPGVVGAVNV